MVPVNPSKHVVADGQKLHDSFIKMEIFKPFKQVSVPRNHKKGLLFKVLQRRLSLREGKVQNYFPRDKTASRARTHI